MPETAEALVVLLFAVLPGALHIWAAERESGRWGIGLSDRFLRFVGTTAVYQAAYSYPLYLIWTRYLHHRVSNGNGKVSFLNHVSNGTAPGWLWLIPVAYIALPMVVGTVSGVSVQRWRRLSRILVGRDPAPTSWEFLFSRHPEGVIRARLKSDGRWVGGLFGPNSYAAGYREEPQDLFIERTYRLLEDGTFAEGDSVGGYDELGSTLLVRWDELDQLEFFPSGERV